MFVLAALGVSLLVQARGATHSEPSFHIVERPLRQIRVTRVERFESGMSGWVAHLMPTSTHNQRISSVEFFLDGKPIRPSIGTTEEGLSKVAYFRCDRPGPFEVKFVCKAILFSRVSVPGAPQTTIKLSPEEQALALKSSYPEDYRAADFQHFLDEQGLRKGAEEASTKFIVRVAEWFAVHEKYLDDQPKSDGLGILRAGGGQCNQLNAAFTMILKSNGIPARCYPGYVGHTFDSEVDGHMNSEAWLDGIGWVSTDAVRFSSNRSGVATLGNQTDPILTLGFNSLTIFRAPNNVRLGGFNWRHFQLALDDGQRPKLTKSRNLTEIIQQF